MRGGGGWRSLVRVSAFPRKELTEIVRQPLLVLALVLGPFLILLVFGATLRDRAPTVSAILVGPSGSPLIARAERLEEGRPLGIPLVITEVTTDFEPALAQLRAGVVGLVVVIPQTAEEAIRADQQVPITVFHNRLDPIENEVLRVFTLRLLNEANQEALTTLIAQAQAHAAPVTERVAGIVEELAQVRTALEQAEQEISDPALLAEPLQRVRALEQDLGTVTEGLELFGGSRPDVLVSPFTVRIEQIGAANIRLADFYAPAAVALLLQHLLITFTGLSIVREEQLGTVELFRVSPITSWEALLGRYLAYLGIGAIIAGGVVGLLVLGLGVPMAGSWPLLAAALAGLLFASVGLGCLIGLIADTDSQAVQYALILLLASIFFSGFLLTLDRFAPPLPLIARLLPATYGIELLREVMLRGAGLDGLRLTSLFAMGFALQGLSYLLLRRRMLRG